MNLESKVAVLESILVNLESIWGELESISAISESKSLIWKFQLFENEKSPFMRVKSHDKIADPSQLSPQKTPTPSIDDHFHQKTDEITT